MILNFLTLSALLVFGSTSYCDYTLDPVLSDEQISHFLEHGYLVVNVLDKAEIQQAKIGIQQTLERFGVIVDNLAASAGNLQRVSSGVGGIIETYYDEWKLRINTHPKVFSAVSQIWESTYASSKTAGFEHPFGPFDPKRGFLYVDRWSFRIPDIHVAQYGTSVYGTPLQYGLHPHFDADPLDLFGSAERSARDPKGIPPRWRPIQAFVSLSNTSSGNHGGFEVVPGFHQIFEMYFNHKSNVGQAHGEFFNLVPGHHDDIMQSLKHIDVGEGDLVLWDWRMPHRNAAYHEGHDPRIVGEYQCAILRKSAPAPVYTGFLPDVRHNHAYAAEQRDAIADADPPPDFYTTPKELMTVVPPSFEITPLVSQLFGRCLKIDEL